MSWSISAEVSKENAVEQIMQLSLSGTPGEGAKFQSLKAKEAACEFIASGAAQGERFGVSLSGHSQSDSPGSAPDSLTITIYARQ